MLDREKGKAKATTSRKRNAPQALTLFPYAHYAKNPVNKVNKNQQLQATDMAKFRKKGMNMEKRLSLPNDVRHSIETRIQELGLHFIDREMERINTSWVREFYCNFSRATLDSVHLRGGQILITEVAIEDALYCPPRTGATDACDQAEIAIHTMTFDYDMLKHIIATRDAIWVMASENKRPKGMLFTYLTREARTWQQIFACYVMPTMHFTKIPMDMLVLIGCVMDGKEVYFPKLVRRSMWRAHIRGLLPFPSMVTRMIELAGVPWRDDDKTPPPPTNDDKEDVIPWGGWIHEKSPSRHRSRARVAIEAPGPSAPAVPSSSAAAAPISPPLAPEPTYLLVQCLFRFMERSECQIIRHLDRIDQIFVAQGIELPPLPESSDSDKETHEEEHAEVHEEEPVHIEAPP
ncbi:hypothetical protein Ahy_A01g002447 [Arachis hypogaea]|uniref:Putative plant transposon protein domain-containing protein n=1 Tax=Arachis hypogaea TaxID=3818 RepID=A0A445ER81_ARAHY|nr:hypothetical protein Ahy_A01g002447 [Arachis hypogaea]